MSTIQRLTINAALLLAAVGSSASAGTFTVRVYTENAGELAHPSQFTYQYTYFSAFGLQTVPATPAALSTNPRTITIPFTIGVDPKVTVTVTRGNESHTFTRTNTATGIFPLNTVFHGSTPMVFFTHHPDVTSQPVVSCPPPCAHTYTCQPARRFKRFGCR
jgi:hypothetical protein